MTYLLDTNVWIAYLNDRHTGVTQRLLATAPFEIVLSSVVLAELYYGAYKGARTATNLSLLSDLGRRFVQVPFDDAAAMMFGHIRAVLGRAGTPIGPYDLMIAATALANDLTLVTHNTAEFGRVPGLRVEDWQTTP